MSPRKKWVTLLASYILLIFMHEGTHMFMALMLGEYETLIIHPYGFEVVFKTSVADRVGFRWFLISGVSNIVTVFIGYLLLYYRGSIASMEKASVRLFLYWLGALCLVADPLNLAFGPFIYGGDAYGLAAGLQTDVVVIQLLFLGMFVINRELLAQYYLPAFGVKTGHPLYKPWFKHSD